MQLTYRGNNYTYTPPTATPPRMAVTGTYRGVPVQFTAAVPNPPPADNLKYRGTAYPTVAPVAQPVPAPIPAPTIAPTPATTAPAPSLAVQCRELIAAHVRHIRRREEAVLVRMDQALGLTPEAAHYHSAIQGKLPNHLLSYDRSHAAMS